MDNRKPVIAYFDGLCEPRNPGGYACGGYLIEPHDESGGKLTLGWKYFGNGEGHTNNTAEYEAALTVLRVIWNRGYRGPVILRGDSQLVVRHFNGQYQCKADLLIPLLARLKKAAESFESLTMEWVHREVNKEADEQSRAAYRETTGEEPPERRASL